jgi:ribosomal protein L37AE/L43A
MELRSRNSHSSDQLRPIAPCAQCGHTLFGPEWSEPLTNSRIRHLWACTACGYVFETLVFYPMPEAWRD